MIVVVSVVFMGLVKGNCSFDNWTLLFCTVWSRDEGQLLHWFTIWPKVSGHMIHMALLKSHSKSILINMTSFAASTLLGSIFTRLKNWRRLQGFQPIQPLINHHCLQWKLITDTQCARKLTTDAQCSGKLITDPKGSKKAYHWSPVLQKI